MQIRLNGRPFEADTPRLGELIERLDLAGKRFAVEVNEALVPRAEQATYILREGDQVEIVQAIGGG
jgi:sulfur carrier protein